MEHSLDSYSFDELQYESLRQTQYETPSETQYETINTAIAETGLAIIDNALPESITRPLYAASQDLRSDQFHSAGIGRNNHFQQNKAIRSDAIHWLDPQENNTQAYFNWMENLRQRLNQKQFLGLFEYECHFAHYKPGTFYSRHTDAFKTSRNRIVTTILYLNPDWDTQSGGELLIYNGGSGEVVATVYPEFGRLVVFLSEEFPHEVLPAVRDRHSLAGWFRVNEQGCKLS